MIYIFDNEGRCLRSSDDVKKRGVAGDPAIAAHMNDMRDSGAMYYMISDHEFNIWEIYYEDGAIKKRVPVPARVEGMTLLNLPVPCTVEIEGVKYEVDESELELDFQFSGVYAVRVIRFPYLDRILKVKKP